MLSEVLLPVILLSFHNLGLLFSAFINFSWSIKCATFLRGPLSFSSVGGVRPIPAGP